MSKRRPGRGRSKQEQPKAEPASPFNNPFGALQGIRDEFAPGPQSDADANAPLEPDPRGSETTWGKIVVSAEKKGRAGKTVTRGCGLPPKEGPALARQIKTALGSGATFEGDDLLLLGSLVQRCVLKKDQASGVVTRGVLREILTRSATHPHGIKVRLEDGAVGRVKRCVPAVERCGGSGWTARTAREAARRTSAPPRPGSRGRSG